MLIEDGVSTSTQPAEREVGPGRLPRLIGRDLEVPLANGTLRRYANLDYAASTPAMEPVVDAITAVLPWYSSVHRGTGFASQVSTRAYEAARATVAAFVRPRPPEPARTGRSTWWPRASTSSPSPDTRCTRRSAPARWWVRRRCAATPSRCWPGAAQ